MDVTTASVVVGACAVAASALYVMVINPAESAVKEVAPNTYSVEVTKDTDGHGIRRHADFKSKLVAAPEGGETVYHALERSIQKHADLPCFGVRPIVKIHEEKKMIDGEEKIMTFPELGPFQWITYRQAGERINNFASGLRNLGMKPQDKLAIFEDTRVEWTIASRASYCQSIVVFTVYANLGEDALVFALNQGEIEYMITNSTLLRLVAKISSPDGVKSLKHVIHVGPAEQKDIDLLKSKGITVHSFEAVEQLGKEKPVAHSPPSPKDLACIMYTSGSTGTPKGVQLTHANLGAALGGMERALEVRPDDVYLNYLPLAHIFAFVVEAVFLCHGASLGYGNPRTLAATGVRNCEGDIKECRPTLLIAVPTIYERLKQGVLSRISKAGPVSKTLFNIAFKAKLNALRRGSDTPLWNKIVFSKFLDNVGGRLRMMASGSAPLSPDVHDFLRVCFGVPVIQGYGLTETCSSGAVQSPTDMHTARIGAPFPSMEMKLVDVPDMGYTSNDKPYPRGEIWCRGGPVSIGYYKEPEKTAEAFVDGWFATGDIGVIYPDGSFAIIDRKKNLIKPPHGEYIALEKLESVYRNCAFVETILVFVDSYHHHCVCVVVPNREPLIEWATKNSSLVTAPVTDFAALCKDPAVLKHVLHELQHTGRILKLKSIEVVRALRLLPDQWTPQNLYLTAAMKLNRNYIITQVRPLIDEMYDEIGNL